MTLFQELQYSNLTTEKIFKENIYLIMNLIMAGFIKGENDRFITIMAFWQNAMSLYEDWCKGGKLYIVRLWTQWNYGRPSCSSLLLLLLSQMATTQKSVAIIFRFITWSKNNVGNETEFNGASRHFRNKVKGRADREAVVQICVHQIPLIWMNWQTFKWEKSTRTMSSS